ncbi:hypothetical protein GX888_00350 [Candidatus Dojkabacteria bacterium]|uniref:DUF3592 domain-containing protein n=1 Tax=Candidatus Dojkabacteria bacterium TaxID=2099670 RepID=A0A847VCJ3_9BACT|nr:hypothetical protein [Candidatus Dojkabacteria bacterium]
MPEYIYTVIIVIVIIVIAFFYSKKKANEEWKGELIRKRKNYGDENSVDTYTLVFRTEDGKKKKGKITSLKDFNNWKVGDKAEKKKGEYVPRKI